MAIATCGHEVKDGVTIEIHSFTKEGDPCINYGTYCGDCLFEYYKEGMVANKEFHDFLAKIKD